MEEEKKEHDLKIEKMRQGFEDVFSMKVKEKVLFFWASILWASSWYPCQLSIIEHIIFYIGVLLSFPAAKAWKRRDRTEKTPSRANEIAREATSRTRRAWKEFQAGKDGVRLDSQRIWRHHQEDDARQQRVSSFSIKFSIPFGSRTAWRSFSWSGKASSLFRFAVPHSKKQMILVQVLLDHKRLSDIRPSAMLLVF